MRLNAKETAEIGNVPLDSHPPKPTKLLTLPPMTLRPLEATDKRQYLVGSYTRGNGNT